MDEFSKEWEFTIRGRAILMAMLAMVLIIFATGVVVWVDISKEVAVTAYHFWKDVFG
jgi:hypothetical protein